MKYIKNKVDFKFFKNWKTITNWHEIRRTKGIVTSWTEQKHMIETTFNATAPFVVNWLFLWNEVETWYQEILRKNGHVKWSEQRRQIETIMLTQLDDLNSKNFMIAYLDKNNKPRLYLEYMTYWDAISFRKQNSSDGDGNGGNQEMDKISIVNLNNLIQ